MAAKTEAKQTRTLPLLPLKNAVVFPHVLVPLAVGRPRSLALIEQLPAGDRLLAMSAQIDEDVEEAGWDDVHHTGTLVRIQHLIKLPDGTYQLAVQGLARLRLLEATQHDPFLTVSVEPHPEPADEGGGIEMEALYRSAVDSFQQLVAIAPYLPGELLPTAINIEDPLHLAYFIANHVKLATDQRQEILELPTARAGAAARPHGTRAGGSRAWPEDPDQGRRADGQGPEGVLPA